MSTSGAEHPPIIIARCLKWPRPDAIVIDVGTGKISFAGKSFRYVAERASFKIICAILSTCGTGTSFISHDDLINFVWADDPDGGPMMPKNHLSKVVCCSQPLFHLCGIVVRAAYGSGYLSEWNSVERKAA